MVDDIIFSGDTKKASMIHRRIAELLENPDIVKELSYWESERAKLVTVSALVSLYLRELRSHIASIESQGIATVPDEIVKISLSVIQNAREGLEQLVNTFNTLHFLPSLPRLEDAYMSAFINCKPQEHGDIRPLWASSYLNLHELLVKLHICEHYLLAAQGESDDIQQHIESAKALEQLLSLSEA